MREILFRGKQNAQWIEGNLLIDEAGNCYIGTYLKSSRCDSFVAGGGRRNGKTANRFWGIGFALVSPETMGQFTGLTDKNGVKIFEGDIVKGKDRLEKDLEVYGYIDHKNGSFVIVGDFMTHYRWLDYAVEVIGNIHDNPELLEVEHG